MWLRTLRLRRAHKCHRSRAQVRLALNRSASWPITVSMVRRNRVSSFDRWGFGVSALVLVRGEQEQAVACQVRLPVRPPVVAVADGQPAALGHKGRGGRRVRDVGGRQLDLGHRPAVGAAEVDAEAVERVADQVVVAVGRAAALEQPGALGPGEPADVQREAVEQPQRLARHLVGQRQAAGQAAVEQLRRPPQVGRLPHDGGAVDAAHGGELPQVVAAEERVDPPVGVDPQELGGQDHRQHLTVRQHRLAAVAPQRAGRAGQLFQFLVDQAEQTQQVVVEAHGRPPSPEGVGTTLPTSGPPLLINGPGYCTRRY